MVEEKEEERRVDEEGGHRAGEAGGGRSRKGGKRQDADRRTDGRCSELSQGLRTPTERATATATLASRRESSRER